MTEASTGTSSGRGHDTLSTSRVVLLVAGVGMAVFSGMTIEHFFAANYPVSIFEGSFCDINAFFNCDSSAYSNISAIAGVPIGWFGLMLGGLFALYALFPSERAERTGRWLAAINVIGVLSLLVYSVAILGSLCLLCSGFYVFSFVALGAFWAMGRDGDAPLARRWLSPAPLQVAVFGIATLSGAWGVRMYHDARAEAQTGSVASRIVSQYYSLPHVDWPSEISELRVASATEDFDAAPIRIVEYGDLLCSDCRLLFQQMQVLKEEFAGKINLAFQLFPLEAECNDVVEKDLHEGACEVSYIAAHDPEKFPAIYQEVFETMRSGRDPEWRRALAERHGVEAALTDSATMALVRRQIQTGAEYEKTSDQFAHGIRSTPTMIINNRMIIGTLPLQQMRALFQALVDEWDRGGATFIENWESTR